MYFGFGEELTERLYRSAFEDSVVGIVVINSSGTILKVNNSVYDIFGYNKEDTLIGKNVTILMPPEIGNIHDSYLQKYLKTGIGNIIGIGREITAIRKDETKTQVHLSVISAKIGEETYFIGHLDDISKLREEKLMRRIGFSWLLHEMKTPLNAILGFAQLGEIYINKGNPKLNELLNYFNVIYDQGLKLLTHTDSLSDILEMTTGKYKPKASTIQPEKLEEKLRKIGNQELVSREKKLIEYDVNIEIDENEPILTDQRLFSFLSQNLISNAFKYTEKGNIKVELKKKKSLEGTLELSVSDTGIGIKEEEISELFGIYTHTANSYEDKGSRGLGLYIAKTAANLLGGTIEIKSEFGVGTTFTATLPNNPQNK